MDIESQTQALNSPPVAVVNFETCINPCTQHVFRAGLLRLGAINMSAARQFLVRDIVLCISGAHSIPGLWSLDATSIVHLYYATNSVPECQMGEEIPLVEKRLFRKILLTAVCGWIGEGS